MSTSGLRSLTRAERGAIYERTVAPAEAVPCERGDFTARFVELMAGRRTEALRLDDGLLVRRARFHEGQRGRLVGYDAVIVEVGAKSAGGGGRDPRPTLEEAAALLVPALGAAEADRVSSYYAWPRWGLVLRQDHRVDALRWCYQAFDRMRPQLDAFVAAPSGELCSAISSGLSAVGPQMMFWRDMAIVDAESPELSQRETIRNIFGDYVNQKLISIPITLIGILEALTHHTVPRWRALHRLMECSIEDAICGGQCLAEDLSQSRTVCVAWQGTIAWQNSRGLYLSREIAPSIALGAAVGAITRVLCRGYDADIAAEARRVVILPERTTDGVKILVRADHSLRTWPDGDDRDVLSARAYLEAQAWGALGTDDLQAYHFTIPNRSLYRLRDGGGLVAVTL